MPSRIKREVEDLIVEMYLKGDSSLKISDKIGICTTTVSNVLKRNNLKARSLIVDKPISIQAGEKIEEKNIKKLPSKEEILERFDYFKEEGRLISKRTGRWDIKLDKEGYRRIFFEENFHRHSFKEHRAIFFLETGEEPDYIDHIDGNKSNNHISNLRGVSAKENARNRKSRKNKKYKGVSFIRDCKINPWRMTLKIGGKTYIEVFETELEAAKAYNKAALEHFGEFAYLNVFEDETEEN